MSLTDDLIELLEPLEDDIKRICIDVVKHIIGSDDPVHVGTRALAASASGAAADALIRKALEKGSKL